MSEENEIPENEDVNGVDTSAVTELSLLKDRAKLMGLEFSNNIGLAALKKRIEAAMEGEKEEPEPKEEEFVPPVATAKVNPLLTEEAPVKRMTLRQHLNREAMKLVRVRITNMDPKKKDLPGEIITVGNEYIGTVKKYIPFGEASDEGYHVPHCIYEELDSRRFLNIRVTKDPVTKQTRVNTSWAREFSLDILPPLTKKELQDLATAQIAAGNS